MNADTCGGQKHVGNPTTQVIGRGVVSHPMSVLGTELNSGPLQEQQVLLTTVQSLHPLH